MLMPQGFAQLVDFSFQLLNLVLLFLDCVDEHGRQLRIVHTFNLTVLVFESQTRLNPGDIFSDQADIRLLISFPVEAYWLQTIDEL